MSNIDWENFQLRTVFPNTEPGSSHTGLEFACFKCGTQILEEDDIFEIKRGAIWTHTIPDTITYNKKGIYNKWKKCTLHNAECQSCGFSVGSVYLQPYADCGDKAFPCAKLTYQRESKNGCELFNSMALTLASENERDDALERLVLSSDQSGVTETGVRLTARLFDSHINTVQSTAAKVSAVHQTKLNTTSKALSKSTSPFQVERATACPIPAQSSQSLHSNQRLESKTRHIDASKATRLLWKDYQLRIKFPNTSAGSPHRFLAMACFKCGTQIIDGADINRIYRGAIWTSRTLPTLRQGQEKMYNPFKKCDFYDAECQHCGVCVGTIFPTLFQDCDSRPLPCAKLTYQREKPDGTPVNALAVIASSRDQVDAMLASLTMSSDQTGITTSGVRLNTKMYRQYAS